MSQLLMRYLVSLRLLIRLILFMIGLAVFVPLIKILMPFKSAWAHQMCRWVHRYSSWCFNVGITHMGVPIGNSSSEPVLYVINHISWVDIVVIGSIVRGCFVAKSELETWPVFGPLADLQRTIYVKREDRHKANDQKNSIADRLSSGANVILFPEGTSGLGTTVLPFKTSLFGLTDDPRLVSLIIQPVTISYTHLNGLPLLRAQRALIAWVGDMGFGTHAAQLLVQSSMRAVVQFHPVVRRCSFANRKSLSAACQHVIADGLQRANTDRLETSVAAPLSDRLSVNI